MDLNRKKIEIKKNHHINLKQYMPNIKNIHFHNIVENGEIKKSCQVRKRIQPGNFHIFKTTNICNPIQLKVKKINESIKKETKQISEENKKSKSNAICMKQANVFRKLNLNPKIMHNILKFQ